MSITIDDSQFQYRNIACNKMTEEEIEECAALFTKNYGKWAEPPEKRGKNAIMTVQRFKRYYVDKPDRYIALVYYQSKIIGQAIYLRRMIIHSNKHKGKHVSFVLQLVVQKEYRGQELGRRLLYSIWGTSEDYAWGIMTSNPLTIKCLEDARYRKININYFKQRVHVIETVLYDVFDDNQCINEIKQGCRIDTHFPIDHSQIQRRIDKYYPDGSFPFKDACLEPSEEWIAFVFGGQKIDTSNKTLLKTLTETNPDVLHKIYSNIDVSMHYWASHTLKEIDYLVKNSYIKPGNHILDLGSGNCRHAIELGNRGYNVHCVDFVQYKHKKEFPLPPNVSFECANLLNYQPQKKYDVVLCLYDIIGAYSSLDDNKKIIEVISASLKDDGIAVVSVMNMHLTKKICKNFTHDIVKDINRLSSLPASQFMQKTGNCFDGRYLLIDESTQIVYHKDRFSFENCLPVEYIIPERRFTKNALESLFSPHFSIVKCQFVQSGAWEKELKPESEKAKEILLVLQKRKISSKINKFKIIIKVFIRKQHKYLPSTFI